MTPNVADILIEALPYIQSFRDKYVVIKLGGSMMGDKACVGRILIDVVFMELCPISSCTRLRLTPLSSICVAKECLSTCGDTFFLIPAFSAAIFITPRLRSISLSLMVNSSFRLIPVAYTRVNSTRCFRLAGALIKLCTFSGSKYKLCKVGIPGSDSAFTVSVDFVSIPITGFNGLSKRYRRRRRLTGTRAANRHVSD